MYTYKAAIQRLIEMGLSYNHIRSLLAKVRQTPNHGWVTVTGQYQIRVSYEDATQFVII